jgi:small subunit ribosomal protein S6
MRFYESLFIVRPSLSDEEVSQLIDKIKGVLEKAGATLLKIENWGKKKLAYKIQRERRGTYVYLLFQAAGRAAGELERTYRLEDAVLKFLTIRLKHPPVEAAADKPVAQEPAALVSEQAQEPERDRV